MKFHLFMLPTVGQPHELMHGMAGERDEYYQRALNFDEFFIWLNQGLSPHAQALENLELFAAKVMSRFR